MAGLRIVDRSAFSPTLPYITATTVTEQQAGHIRQVMNQALQEPGVAEILGLQAILPATDSDYQIVLDYQREAEDLGFGRLR